MKRQAFSIRDFSDKISYAFQLATGQGPLCQEPVQGIAVFIEDVAINPNGEELDVGRLTGEAIKAVRDSIWQGFLDWSPRILLAMYSCEIQASSMFYLIRYSPPRMYIKRRETERDIVLTTLFKQPKSWAVSTE